MQTFWKKTCRELYRRTTLTEAQTRETTDQVLDEAMWEAARPWGEQWESLKVNESKMVEQELDDEDRQARFWRRRPDGFVVNEKEHIIYVLEFKRVSDAGQEYVSETQQLAEAQHLAVTQGLQKLFKDTQWTVEQLSFVAGHKSVSASIWHDLLSKFSIMKEDRVLRYCSLAISSPRRHPFVVVIYDKACKMYVFSSRGESQPLLHALCEGPCIQYIEATLMHLQICDKYVMLEKERPLQESENRSYGRDNMYTSR